MTLYEINEELKRAIEESVDTETGEILDYTRINELKIARDEKREAVALYIKNLQSDAKAIDEEIKALTVRKKAKANRADNLKQYLAQDLQDSGLNKFETSKVALTFRKSQILEVTSTENIPPEFFRQSEPVLDKIALKKELKAGFIYDGVALIDKQNIQIK